MNTVILTPMARGQITLPKKFREKLGITPKTPLSVSLRKKEIVVKPMESEKVSERYVIKAKYTPAQYLKILQKVSAHMKKHGPLWTGEDDERRAESLKKEMEKAKRLNW